MVLSGPPPAPVTTRASSTTGVAVGSGARSGGSASDTGGNGCESASAMSTVEGSVRVRDRRRSGGERGCGRGRKDRAEQRLQTPFPMVVLLDILPGRNAQLPS